MNQFLKRVKDHKLFKMMETVQPLLSELSDENLEETYMNIKSNGYLSDDFIHCVLYDIISFATKRFTRISALVWLYIKIYSNNNIKRNKIFSATIKSMLTNETYISSVIVHEFVINESKVLPLTEKNYLTIENNYQNYSKFRESILKIIDNDDIDTFQKIASEPLFLDNRYSVILWVDHEPKNLYEYACFVGASKCVKYLFVNFRHEFDYLPIRCAIFGGNAEILRFFEQEKCSYDDPRYLIDAIDSMQYDIYDWLLERQNKDRKSLTIHGIRNNWSHCIYNLEPKTLQKVLGYKEIQNNPIISIIEEINQTYIDFINLCINGEVEQIMNQYNTIDINQWSLLITKYSSTIVYPIQVACQHNQIEVVKFLLSLPNLQIYNYQNRCLALSHAIANRCTNVVLLLLEREDLVINDINILRPAVLNCDLFLLGKLLDKANFSKEMLKLVLSDAINLKKGPSIKFIYDKINEPCLLNQLDQFYNSEVAQYLMKNLEDKNSKRQILQAICHNEDFLSIFFTFENQCLNILSEIDLIKNLLKNGDLNAKDKKIAQYMYNFLYRFYQKNQKHFRQ